MISTCPFCDSSARPIVASNARALAIRDGFPVSPGHTLVIPRRHLASLAELTQEEARALWALLGEARKGLEAEFSP